MASLLHRQKYSDILSPEKSTLPFVGSYAKVSFPAFSTHGPTSSTHGEHEALHALGTKVWSRFVKDPAKAPDNKEAKKTARPSMFDGKNNSDGLFIFKRDA
jgi:hypothetical protein